MRLRNEVITSRNNSLVKWVCTLHSKKGREESRSFIAEGIKLAKEAVSAGLSVSHLLLSDSKRDVYFEEFEKLSECGFLKETELVFLSDSVFEKISTENSPQGVVAVIKYLDFFSYMDIIYKEDFFSSRDERAIILCSVRDPSNLGAVIRSAVAFGVDRIFLSDDCAELYNPKTVRSAMGSLFRVKTTRVKSLSDLIQKLREMGRRVYSAELTENAVSLTEVGLLPLDCVVIGNEGHGIPFDISALTDGSIYIPISKKTESLNASVAAAIFMWEQSKYNGV